MTPKFDAFIAVDWSGATKDYKGVAVAKCKAGSSAPRLVVPNSTSLWTRSAIADWLNRELGKGLRLLIGFDFAFGFPFEKDCGYLGGQAHQVKSIFELWDLIDRQSCTDADFGCATFLDDPKYASLFWKSGPRPQAWMERKRRTELACAKATQTHPDTVYKLLGSKQVGKASITGIRVLNRVRSLRKAQVAFWPFEQVGGSVIVEIYPTLFRKTATSSIAKLRTLSGLNKALERFDSRPVRNVHDPSDHETDALLSAAGLRWLAGVPGIWTPQELSSSHITREGWIFGVR